MITFALETLPGLTETQVVLLDYAEIVIVAFFTAEYLRTVLLPEGQVLGWAPGNFAGYPFFQFYFPLPFLLIVALGAVMVPPALGWTVLSNIEFVGVPAAPRIETDIDTNLPRCQRGDARVEQSDQVHRVLCFERILLCIGSA